MMCKKRILSVAMSICVLMFITTINSLNQSISAATISNPRIVYDKNMISGEKVTWDCIWFGEYPQTEVKKTESIFNRLEQATNWSGNGDVYIDGNKYRRITKSNATYSKNEINNCYYNWEDSTSYHYFKYEPIKWRVLKIEGNVAFLLADKVLDCQPYHLGYENITWQNSTIRSWLNGYSTTYNDGHTDGTGNHSVSYAGRSFLYLAFNSYEQNCIGCTTVINKDGLTTGAEGGNDTEDKIFLLSESEVYSDEAIEYGFSSLSNVNDEARVAKYSEYAKAMGVYCYDFYNNKYGCKWWLRSPEIYSYYGSNVNVGGCIRNFTDYDSYEIGVRPALKLNMEISDIYAYAGIVSSDGNINVTEETTNKPVENTKKEQVIDVQSINKTYSSKPFSLNAKTTGNGKLTYKSSNTKVAKISSSGKVTMMGYGKATITITAPETNCYKAATKKIEITVNPKKAKLLKVKSPRQESMKISWEKDKLATGYQVQFSTNKKFKKGLRQRYFNKNQKSITVPLKKKSGKKYYVRIRSYKRMSGVDYYSKWSKVKKVTIK